MRARTEKIRRNPKEINSIEWAEPRTRRAAEVR